MKRPLYFWILFVSVCFNLTFGYPDSQYVERIMEISKANKHMIESFDYSYSIKFWNGDNPSEIKLEKIGRYALKGNKLFSQESIVGTDESLLFVKNGNKKTLATQSSPSSPRLIAIETNMAEKATLKPGTPGLWTSSGMNIIFELGEEGFEGIKAEFVSEEVVTIEEEPYIKMALNRSVPKGDGTFSKIPTTVWFSINNGYLIKKFECVLEDFYSTGEVISVGRYKCGDEEIVIPLEFTFKQIIHGQISNRKYSILPDSVKINPDLPDELFVVEIQPDDQVINLDVDYELQGPGGRLFLEDFLDADDKVAKIDTRRVGGDNSSKNKVVLCDNITMDLVYIPLGEFLMGSPEDEIGYPDYVIDAKKKRDPNESTRDESEGPVHKVRIDKGYYLSKYEVTCEQFRCFKKNYKSMVYEGESFDNNTYPACVTWNQANEFCKWLSLKSGLQVRLPSEEEWEYACRAGTQTRFYWGATEEDAGKYANISDKTYCEKWPRRNQCINTDDGSLLLTSVGMYQPNNFGLYDMIGNVAEWCSDIYIEDAYSLSEAEYVHSVATIVNPVRVYRGGAFASNICFARCAARWYAESNDSNLFVGFRVLIEE